MMYFITFIKVFKLICYKCLSFTSTVYYLGHSDEDLCVLALSLFCLGWEITH